MVDEPNNRPPDQYGNREPSTSSQEPDADNAEYISRDEQKQFGTRPDDQYGAQDQFGDLDDQDPYSNLYDEDPGSTPGGEGLEDPEDVLYGLAEPTGGSTESGGADASDWTKGTGDGRWG
jgi:hypothetical protein